MKIFKIALVLTLVGLLCGVVIGVANYVTAPIIKKNAEKRAQEAYKSFFSDLDGITEHEVIDSNVYVYPDVNIEMLKDLKLTRTVVLPINFFIQNKELKDKLEEANYEILRLKSKLVVGGTKEIPKLSYS